MFSLILFFGATHVLLMLEQECLARSDFRVKWPSLNTENDGFSLHLFLSHTTFGEEIGQAISKSLEVCTFQTYVCVYALMHVDICG